MKTTFWKMHGAANDFVLLDDRSGTFPCANSAWIQEIATRRTGIGCEGVILIQNSPSADFRMRFFNPDGSEVDMCGNGARCVARLAYDLGVAKESMTIDTVAGQLAANIHGDQVQLNMTTPKDWRFDGELEVAGQKLAYSFVNSGVPHAVVEVPKVEDCDVQTLGAGIRYHKDFAPKGTNANFVTVESPNKLRVRTYERGVEGETLACGTGIVASALVCAKRGRVKAPVTVQALSGDLLTVGMTLTATGAENVTLLGPAVYVFEGVLTVPA